MDKNRMREFTEQYLNNVANFVSAYLLNAWHPKSVSPDEVGRTGKAIIFVTYDREAYIGHYLGYPHNNWSDMTKDVMRWAYLEDFYMDNLNG